MAAAPDDLSRPFQAPTAMLCCSPSSSLGVPMGTSAAHLGQPLPHKPCFQLTRCTPESTRKPKACQSPVAQRPWPCSSSPRTACTQYDSSFSTSARDR